MLATKTLVKIIPAKSVSILLISLFVAILVSCSGGDVNGPNFNVSTGGFPIEGPDFTVQKTAIEDIPTLSRIRVIVESTNGEVVVTGREDVNNVMVTAHLFVSSDRLIDAERQLDNLDILVTGGANEITIQTVRQQTFNGCTCRVEYDIIVPDNFEVTAKQANGAVAILDIQNRVEVSNENGNVFLFGIAGGILADVENGDIEATVVLPLNDNIHLSVRNGGLVLSIPTSTSTEFAATVHGIGEIFISNLHLIDSLTAGNSLTGTLGNGEGSTVLSAVNGNIEVIGFD